MGGLLAWFNVILYLVAGNLGGLGIGRSGVFGGGWERLDSFKGFTDGRLDRETLSDMLQH